MSIYTQECAYMDRYICIIFFSPTLPGITELWNRHCNYDTDKNKT